MANNLRQLATRIYENPEPFFAALSQFDDQVKSNERSLQFAYKYLLTFIGSLKVPFKYPKSPKNERWAVSTLVSRMSPSKKGGYTEEVNAVKLPFVEKLGEIYGVPIDYSGYYDRDLTNRLLSSGGGNQESRMPAAEEKFKVLRYKYEPDRFDIFVPVNGLDVKSYIGEAPAKGREGGGDQGESPFVAGQDREKTQLEQTVEAILSSLLNRLQQSGLYSGGGGGGGGKLTGGGGGGGGRSPIGPIGPPGPGPSPIPPKPFPQPGPTGGAVTPTPAPTGGGVFPVITPKPSPAPAPAPGPAPAPAPAPKPVTVTGGQKPTVTPPPQPKPAPAPAPAPAPSPEQPDALQVAYNRLVSGKSSKSSNSLVLNALSSIVSGGGIPAGGGGEATTPPAPTPAPTTPTPAPAPQPNPELVKPRLVKKGPKPEEQRAEPAQQGDAEAVGADKQTELYTNLTSGISSPSSNAIILGRIQELYDTITSDNDTKNNVVNKVDEREGIAQAYKNIVRGASSSTSEDKIIARIADLEKGQPEEKDVKPKKTRKSPDNKKIEEKVQEEPVGEPPITEEDLDIANKIFGAKGYEPEVFAEDEDEDDLWDEEEKEEGDTGVNPEAVKFIESLLTGKRR